MVIFGVGIVITVLINNDILKNNGPKLNPENLCESVWFESYRVAPIIACFIFYRIFAVMKKNIMKTDRSSTLDDLVM
jgi:hypothetical protein